MTGSVGKWNIGCVVLLAVLAGVLVGCERPETSQLNSCGTSVEQVAESSAPKDFDASITLCRKVSRKSGRRIGIADEFKISEKSSVYGFADFRNIIPERNYTVHLVWVRPDGKDLFRKFADVTVQPVGEAYAAHIRWQKAEDLHYVKEEVVPLQELNFSLSTKLNISAKKARVSGQYQFLVYMDRRLLLSKTFEVLPAETS